MLGIIDEAAVRGIERNLREANLQYKLGNPKQAEKLRADCQKLLKLDYETRKEQV